MPTKFPLVGALFCFLTSFAAHAASSAAAKITIDPPATSMVTSSTYLSGSFKIQNLSTGGQQIQRVVVDISTAILPDLVFDTTGAAGDSVHKGFTKDTSSSTISLKAGVMTQPHNGSNSDDGYDAVDVTFNSFPSGATFSFSADIDPNNVKGVAQPGEHDAASVSGLELIGSTASVYFSDGTTQTTRLGHITASTDGSFGWAQAVKPAMPSISVPGKSSPFQTSVAQQTIHVTGPVGANVTLTDVEAGLYLGGVPNGGYHVSPYDANTAVKVTDTSATIGGSGSVDVPVTLTQTDPKAGYHFITATISDSSGIKGSASECVEIFYMPSGTSDTQPPTQPGALSFSGVTSTSITVHWTAATDNVGVTGYRVSRDGTAVTTVTGLSYTDTGRSPSTSYTYAVVAIDAAGNTSAATTGTVATTNTGSTPATVRVNAGGPTYVDHSGNTWAADFGYNTGKSSAEVANVNGTTDPQLYKTLRWDDTPAPELLYTFSVPNGSYTVKLYFAETSSSGNGSGLRLFNIDLQSQRAFTNVDIFSQAGGMYQALVLQAPATVSDGQLSIRFLHVRNHPRISAIEVIPSP